MGLKQGQNSRTRTITAATYIIDQFDDLILADASSNIVALTLPIASTVPGKIFKVMVTDATNAVTVGANGSETINGSTALITLNSLWHTMEFVSDGSNFFCYDTSGNLVRIQGYSSEQATETPSGTTLTIDWNLGNSITVDLGSASGDVTLTLNSGAAGASYIIKAIQGATARDLIWPAAVLWSGGSAPVITTTNDAVDIIALYCDGTNYYGTIVQDMQ